MQKSQINEMLQQGLDYHRSGKRIEAKAIYDKILKEQPEHFDALQLSATLAVQEECYERAIILFNMALKIKNNHADVYNNLGYALEKLDQLDEALANYDRAIHLKPDNADAYYNRGNALQKLNRLDEALSSYDNAILFRRDNADIYFNHGNVLQKLNRLDEALSFYDKAIALKTDHKDANINRVATLIELGRLEDVTSNYGASEVLAYASHFFYLANSFLERKQPEKALSSYDKAILLRPNYADAHFNRAIALAELDRLNESLASYDKTILLNPDYADAHFNRAITLVELDRLEEALASYDKTIAISPNYVKAHWNKSLLNLLKGDYLTGWEGYEWRWKHEPIHMLLGGKREFTEPLWLGNETLIGKRVLIYAEQGLGDTIQFSRYIQMVKDLGAHVIFEVPEPLIEIFQGIGGVDELILKGQPLPIYDYQCPLLSLPLAFKTNLTNFHKFEKYLFPNYNKVKAWKKELGAKTKKRIGIVWKGGTALKDDANRSLKLEQLVQIMQYDFDYICLQKEISETEKEILTAKKIRFFSDKIKNFSDTAALCNLMDLVISVDTSVAHLAGTLGIRTWIMLPYMPDWRWGLHSTESPWYPSIRLYRQTTKKDWSNVLSNIAVDLNTYR